MLTKSMSQHIQNMRRGTPSDHQSDHLANANANATVPRDQVVVFAIDSSLFPSTSQLCTNCAKREFKSFCEGTPGGELMSRNLSLMAKIYHPILTKFLLTLVPKCPVGRWGLV